MFELETRAVQFYYFSCDTIKEIYDRRLWAGQPGQGGGTQYEPVKSD